VNSTSVRKTSIYHQIDTCHTENGCVCVESRCDRGTYYLLLAASQSRSSG